MAREPSVIDVTHLESKDRVRLKVTNGPVQTIVNAELVGPRGRYEMPKTGNKNGRVSDLYVNQWLMSAGCQELGMYIGSGNWRNVFLLAACLWAEKDFFGSFEVTRKCPGECVPGGCTE